MPALRHDALIVPLAVPPVPLPLPAPVEATEDKPYSAKATQDEQFTAFMQKFDTYLDRSIHERHAGILHKATCYLRDGMRAVRTRPSSAISFIVLFILLMVLPVRGRPCGLGHSPFCQR